MGADIFLIATDTDGVALDYGTEQERMLSRVTPAEALTHLTAGQFPEGSMGPKVSSAVQFVQNTDRRAVIASVEKIEAAIAGKAGTEFITDKMV